jgi:ubiquinone/menaquinone biosynthesis C-methylase UbiE
MLILRADRKSILDYRSIYVNKLIELGKLTQGKNVLDVGCGSGRILIDLKRICPVLDYGLEIRSGALRIAKEIENRTVGDAQNLPVKNDCFDLVYAIRVLHYLDNPQRALKEFSRVCKKGGVVIIFQPNKRNVLYSIFYMLIGGYRRRFFSPKRAVKLLENAGLSDVKWGSIGFIPVAGDSHKSRVINFERLVEKIHFLNSFGSILYVIGKKDHEKEISQSTTIELTRSRQDYTHQ